ELLPYTLFVWIWTNGRRSVRNQCISDGWLCSRVRRRATLHGVEVVSLRCLQERKSAYLERGVRRVRGGRDVGRCSAERFHHLRHTCRQRETWNSSARFGKYRLFGNLQ